MSDQLPPPPGDVPPPPPPPAAPAPVGDALSANDERLWAMLGHIGAIFIGFIAPLLTLLIFGKRSAFVDDQAKESLNFQITVIIASLALIVITIVTLGIGGVLFFGLGIYVLVFCVIAGIKSYGGELYRYPLTLRLVK
ncbi:MAG: DUF4870 domain-containing protein [Candidatus Nanopelagicales bacterium]